MTDSGSRDWSQVRRIGFRFAFVYWALYCLPVSGQASLLDVLPYGGEWLGKVLGYPLQQLSLWVGLHVFHLTGLAATWHPTGSGDTALSYVLVLCVLVLAVTGTAIWTGLDRTRSEYRTLEAWLRLLLCFTLGASMLAYGFAKVFPVQFGPPNLNVLNETYGESTPMRLLWTFMGASTPYTTVCGLAETIAGLLLFFRRTRTLGALLAAFVVFNIVLLNFCYDVPVKLYSSHLLVMAIYLMGPDVPGLVRLFLFRGQAQLRTDHVPAAERKGLRWAGYGLQGLVLLFGLWTLGYGSWQSRSIVPTSRPVLYGVWSVDRAASTVAAVPWQRVIFEYESGFVVRRVDGTSIRLNSKTDASQRTIAITSKKDGDGALQYSVEGETPKRLTLRGRWNGGDVVVELHKTSPESFLLRTQGFHWVHEMPPNR